ncbi:uncharacterized protein TNCV_2721001 [Trichonephila clavipes]|nr:uncharacterized protein TNCV_2721001 [Trichonephila clavipes]
MNKKKTVSENLGWGYQPPSIHRRYPTTARCGSFCLLRFRPRPVRSALDDLVISSSLRCTISTPCLARTPDRHRAAEDRTPNLTSVQQPRLPKQLDYKTTPPVPVIDSV